MPLLGRLDATCLVIGSMAPDFEYFLRGTQVSEVSHTCPGLFLFCLPITLILAWLFHRVVKRPLADLVPGRASTLAARPWPTRSPAQLVLAALVGAATHVVWDGVTHRSGYGPSLWPALTSPVAGLPLYRLLQHLSTLLGLALLARSLRRTWHRLEPPSAVPPRGRALFALCITGTTAATLTRLVAGGFLLDAGNVICASIAGALAGVLLASLIARRAGPRP